MANHSMDNHRLIGASYGKYERRKMARFYDDGFGPVFLYRDASGLLAVIRAQSWEAAIDICCDEVFDDANEDDIRAHYAEHGDDAELPDGCGYRPNGAGSHEWNRTGIYQEDLNGSYLDVLTAEMMEEYGIVLHWESYDHSEDGAPSGTVYTLPAD